MKAYELVIGFEVEEAKQQIKDMEIKYDTLRILSEDDAITCEHNGKRLNIVHNKGNFVTNVYFG